MVKSNEGERNMEIYVLASGSKGNVTYVKTKMLSFFIDAGITIGRIKQKMMDYQLDITEVNTLFLTHEHSDHIAGLKGLLKMGTIKQVFLTKGTYDVLSQEVKILLPKTIIVRADEAVNIADLYIYPLMLSHDAKEPVGFYFRDSNHKKLVLLTDTGYVDHTYETLLQDADVYIVEANHCPSQLIKSSRPYHLKQRILGIKGHLSNEDAAHLMNKLVKNKAIWIVAHMSEDCNTILEVEKAVVEYFDDPNKIECLFASQNSLEKIII